MDKDERSSGGLHPAVDGQGLDERSSGGLHPAVDGQGLDERSSGGLHPAVDGQGVSCGVKDNQMYIAQD